ncbi:family 20 glycosylhydrolase [Actinokineospora sp. HUAS TT18]|uniref:family 20 glycosylhydrolase n=1 Tax=Actinokineospora sp. HUAS TT18 TaxID=3447451 RepID=UPI003F522AF7
MAILPASAAPNSAPLVVPVIREWTGGTGVWTVTPASRIVVSTADHAALSPVAARLAADIAGESGTTPSVTVGGAAAGDIVLALGSTDAAIGDQGYVLSVTDRASISAKTAAGAFNATRTLLQGLRGSTARTSFPQGTIRDWPRYPDRGQMIDVGRRFFPVDYLKSQIRQMSWYKLNVLHLHLSDWNGYRVESLTYPGLAAAERYTQAEIRDLVSYAKTYGVTIVPELDVPAHSSFLSAYDSTLPFSCASLNKPTNVPWEGADTGGWVLDVTKASTRTFITNLIDELVPLFDGPYFHIGGDEIPNDAAKAACPELVAYQQSRGFTHPGDVFTDFINTLNDRIRAKGKTTQLWEWWDYGGAQTSVKPNKNIAVVDWLTNGAHAAAGYQTVTSQDGPFYVSVGFGQKPGDYGYSNPNSVFDFGYSNHANMLGYRISRWMDRSYELPVENVDHFARRPLQAMADRTWGGPKAASFPALVDKIDQLGDGEPGADTALSQTGWTVTASSQETVSENGAAANAADNNQYSLWHTRYSSARPALPAELTVGTGSSSTLSGVRYLPRQDGGTNGKIKDYEVHVAASASGPFTKVAAGQFPNTPAEQRVTFPPVAGSHVKLVAVSEWGGQNTFAAVAEFDVLRARPRAVVPRTGWTIASFSSQETSQENGRATNAIDASPGTIWHTSYSPAPAALPAEVVIDTGSASTFGGFRYLPRQDGGTNGRAKDYEVHLATSIAGPWTKVASGQFGNTAADKETLFTSASGRYVKFRILSEWGPQNTFASAADLNLLR